jgi:hypothetical protein
LQELKALATFIEQYLTVLNGQLTISRNNQCRVSAICLGLALVIPVLFVNAQKPAAKPQPPISWSQGKLQYASDSLGNRIPDFSYCGYKAGEQPIPVVTNNVQVNRPLGDATALIQAAIDYVGNLPLDKNGFRGVVSLEKGVYDVDGSLFINKSGIILRGTGFGEGGTIINSTSRDRANFLQIEGKNDRSISSAIAITDNYVPVNAYTITVADAQRFKTGDQIIISRPSTAEWIAALGTDHFGGGITALGWKPGQRVIEWTRVITAINGNRISFDVPLTTALDKKYGGATIAAYSWQGRINNCGIENLKLVSRYDPANPKDDDHCWMAISIDNAIDTWVRQVEFNHFAGSAVAVYENASRTTIEDCISLHPVSEIGGERRNTFFTAGQQTLFQRCYAENGIHDFVTGFCAPGPNAFVQCESQHPYGFSGGLDSWSSGVLFDIVNVDAQAISFMNRGQDGQGAGWNIANSVLWNCAAARIDCYQPPTAQNWSLGSWSQFAGDGYWGESNNSIEPRSLYYQQLKERIGSSANQRTQVMNIETDATSSPTVEQAAALTRIAYAPAGTVLEFIREAPTRNNLNTPDKPVRAFAATNIVRAPVIKKTPALEIKNGWLVRGDQLILGARSGVPWWSGTSRLYAAVKAGPAITRYVPGRIGKGLTDDLAVLTDSMIDKNITAIEQNYGLWYDRRRDDHERIRRMDGDVWPPFYELPFARSGKELAWDGLSKFDLTKYNYWYWNRLKQFADLADQKGLVLIHQNYFQHNIIEAGAHYADFPWRTANNINNTGFPEPVPYAGDKRIFMAEQFYDTAITIRRELNRQYIRQCLDNFSNNNGVIQLIGEEFTGPLHFVQFWLNTIREWEQEKGKKELIGLATTKDVQDAILANPAYASLIDIIDIRYWYYQADGSAYAPKGGQSLAPRQHARLLKPKSTSPEQVYRAVLEYKTKFPTKAVMYSADAYDRNGWAVLMAGGSFANLKIKNRDFLAAASQMQPVVKGDSKQWELSNPQTGYIIYEASSSNLSVEPSAGNYDAVWINTMNGQEKKDKAVKGGKAINLTKPSGSNWVLWLKKK